MQLTTLKITITDAMDNEVSTYLEKEIFAYSNISDLLYNIEIDLEDGCNAEMQLTNAKGQLIENLFLDDVAEFESLWAVRLWISEVENENRQSLFDAATDAKAVEGILRHFDLKPEFETAA